MGINPKCPKCGGTKVQLSDEQNKHGCFFLILFGVFYFVWLLFRWTLGLAVLVCYDWWMALIKFWLKKGHVWQSRRLLSNRRRIYYCHDCGHNFRA